MKKPAPNLLRYTARLEKLAPLACMAVIFALAWPFLATGWRTDQIPYDWDHMYSGIELTRRGWLNWAPFFSWIPWACGGVVSTDTFTYKQLSVDALFAVLFGSLPGLKLSYVFWQAIGGWGTYRLIRRLFPAAPWPVALAGGVIFGVQGFFLYHLRAGHMTFQYWGALPWIIEGFLFRRVLQTAFFLTVPVLALSLDFNAHAAILAVIFGLILLATDLRSFGFLARTAALSAGLAAVTVWTIGANMSGLVVKHKEYAQSFASLYRLLTRPQMDIWVCDVDCYWEYGAYVGHGLVILGVLGTVWALAAYRKQPLHRLWTTGALVTLLFSLGPFASWAPWSILNRLPLVGGLQVNTRFLASFVLFLILGWSLIVSKIPTAWLKTAAVLLTIVPVLNFAKTSYQLPSRGPLLENMAGRERDVPQVLVEGDAKAFSYNALMGSAAISSCHTSVVDHHAKIGFQNQRPLLLSGPPGAAFHWDGVAFHLPAGPAPGPREWVFNQRYHRKMKAVVSTGAPAETFEIDGLLGVRTGDLPSNAMVRVAVEPTRSDRIALLITMGSWCLFLSLLLARFTWRKR